MIFVLVWIGFITGAAVTTIINPPAEKPQMLCLKEKSGKESCYEIRRDSK